MHLLKMTEHIVDPYSWFGEREVAFTPPHFIITKTPISPESKGWIHANLRGRFSIVYGDESPDGDVITIIWMAGCPAFEDPQEALAYELKWA